MKKLLLFLFVAALFTSCEKDLIEEESINESFEAKKEKDKKNKDHKVWVCHLNKDGSYNLIHISENALKAHLKHGDMGGVVWEGGFEDGIDGWIHTGSGANGYGHLEWASSGTNGISSSVGSYHAVAKGFGGGSPIHPLYDDLGPYSWFDNPGYDDTWPGDYRTGIDIYLDPAWDTSTGFDYSVASANTSGAHRRDFIFHVNKDASTGKLLVGGSNNSNFAPKETIEAGNHFEVTVAGWYTFQHVFYDMGGSLAVDLRLLDSNGNVLFTETRHNAADLIPSIVGGLAYGWFTFINVDGGIAIDQQTVHRGCAF